jgi:hypothetical protein
LLRGGREDEHVTSAAGVFDHPDVSQRARPLVQATVEVGDPGGADVDELATGRLAEALGRTRHHCGRHAEIIVSNNSSIVSTWYKPGTAAGRGGTNTIWLLR